ncbi:hypothetical protein [Corynebacterium heidelbergense]|nr:hypothetical protein [Corynebacterium heidelbergense]
MIDWLISVPVWIQTPLVVAIIIPVAGILAWGLYRLSAKALPLSEAERAYLAADKGTEQKEDSQ